MADSFEKHWFEYSPYELKSWSEHKQIEFFVYFLFSDYDEYAQEYEYYSQLKEEGYGDHQLSDEFDREKYVEEIEEEEVGKNKSKNKSYGTSYFPTQHGSSSSTTSSNYSAQSSFNNWNRKKCPTHDGLHVVYRWTNNAGDVWELAGAQGAEIEVDEELSLVIDLAGMFKPGGEKDAVVFKPSVPQDNSSWNKAMAALDPQVKVPPVLRIKHPDMGIPPVGWKFWVDLYALLPLGRTVVACMGGHGRTGTVLACLILVGSTLTGKEVIDYVRKHHCDNAIESDKQEDYIKKMASKRDALLTKEKTNG